MKLKVLTIIILFSHLVHADTPCEQGEKYDYPIKNCYCFDRGTKLRCPVPKNHKCQDFPLDDCNMCKCSRDSKTYVCTANWCE